jgi:hypothetical protein
MASGWPSQPGRRARPPAAPKPEDLDIKAVRRQQGTRVNPKQPRVKPAPVDNTQSYQQVRWASVNVGSTHVYTYACIPGLSIAVSFTPHPTPLPSLSLLLVGSCC